MVKQKKGLLDPLRIMEGSRLIHMDLLRCSTLIILAKFTLAECTIYDGISFLLAPVRVKPCLLSNLKVIADN